MQIIWRIIQTPADLLDWRDGEVVEEVPLRARHVFLPLVVRLSDLDETHEARGRTVANLRDCREKVIVDGSLVLSVIKDFSLA